MVDFPWWRHAAVYQIYVRSFKDGNGDGTGDIAGIRSRLPYLRDLGVDAIWVNPWYPSPLLDGGYDVADYFDIDPRFGTLDDAKAFIEEAGEMGIRVLVDLVPNHTSWDHEWFQAALDAGPGSPERDRYHFLPGKGPDGSEPPTDWRSNFGGPAWTRVDDGEWYLHLFDVSQPDLNWSNPEVRRHIEAVIRFWLDLGAAGFRIDVAHSLVVDETWPDVGDREEHLLRDFDESRHPFWDRPGVHEIIREWRAVLDEYPGAVMVAEAWVVSWDRLARYIRPDEYHQAFDFDYLESPWRADRLRGAITESLAGAGSVGSIPTWVLSNHDVVRHPTRYGLPTEWDRPNRQSKEWLLDGDRRLLDTELGTRRARASTLLTLALPGSVYLYQGEELGLHEVHDLPADVLEDPTWVRSEHTEKGRDGCRVPIPWEPTGDSFGFGTNGSWLPQPEWFADVAASTQQDVEGSTLELYRSALRIRRDQLVADEHMEWLDLGPDVIAFRRGSGLRCVVNLGDPIELPDGDVLLASTALDGRVLPTDTAVWMG